MKSLAIFAIAIKSIFLFSTPCLADEASVTLSAFNIQVFGRTKAQKATVMKQLAKILNRNELTFVQEIRDQSNRSIHQLLDQANERNAKPLSLALSEPIGRTNSKEQYAYIYDDEALSLVGVEVYQDLQDDFEREPYIGIWENPFGYRFATIGLHARPSDVYRELASLPRVLSYVRNQWDLDDIMIMGDLNADCNYYNPERNGFTMIDPEVWVWIENEADTTVTPTNCAYDRFLTVGDLKHYVVETEVFDFQKAYRLSTATAKQVSDHYPIEISLKLPTSQDGGDFQYDPLPRPHYPLPTPVTPTGPRCGKSPYITPKHYCFSDVDGWLVRVSDSCCFE